MPLPYSISILLPSGEPNGLRILERPNWTGAGIAFSRTGLIEASARHELSNAGVYILASENINDGSLPTIYIGEGDPVLPRLRQHNDKKDFWTSAIAFISKGSPLNKAHIQYLEYQLITLAQKRKLCRLDNLNTPTPPSISEVDIVAMDEFLTNLLGILPLIGLSVFDEPTAPISATECILYLRGKDIQARAVQRPSGFIVLGGSEAVEKISSSCRGTTLNKRKALHESGLLEKKDNKLYFTKDITFTSPSDAAEFVFGRSTNGRKAWKTKEGVTLKQLQEAETESND